MKMSEKSIDIRSIKSLLDRKEKFNIPRYQRGYRWGEVQITELLDDIYEYGQKAFGQKTCEETVGDFYCLQPIVVRCNEKKEPGKTWWDIIDGQQRLTTIFIIIKYIQYLFPEEKEKISLFVIDYETRNADETSNRVEGRKFLKNIDYDKFSEKPNNENIDFYYIDMCSIYIKKWFEDEGHQNAGDIFKKLLASDEKKNVSVIWYEADTNADDDKGAKSFMRLNRGKIPLTDSELIKAFLLQGDRYPENDSKYIHQRLSEIAREWDNIEYHLQKDEMWGFLNNESYKPESRIEYLFRLLSKDWNLSLDESQRIENEEKHFEYHVFEKYINKKRGEKDDIETVIYIFDEIKLLFSVLDEWYNDRKMYHYIGFLVCQRDEEESTLFIKELFDYYQGEGHTKEECLDYIKSKIREIIILEPNQKLEMLNYHSDSDYDQLLKLLLFFNVESTVRLEKEDAYFPFYLYKQTTPSIEHIIPQTPQDDIEQKKVWLEDESSTWSSIVNDTNGIKKDRCIDINKRITNLLVLQDDDFKTEFDILSHDIEKLREEMFGIFPNQTDTLSNYALIGKTTNSKLSNHSFKKKREIINNIIEGKEFSNDKKFDEYIPVCTRNVFQKYYTPQPNNMIFWDNKDREAYFKAMEGIYKDCCENTEATN